MFIISKTIFNYKKLNCVLHFNNDQLPPPPPGPTTSRYSMRSKQNGGLEFTVRPGH